MLQLLSKSTFSLTTWPTIFEFTVWLLAETSITILTATKIAKIKAIIDGIITIIQSPEFMVLVYSQAQNTINKLFMYQVHLRIKTNENVFVTEACSKLACPDPFMNAS